MSKSLDPKLLFGGAGAGFLGIALVATNLASLNISEVPEEPHSKFFFEWPNPPGYVEALENTGEGVVFALGRTAHPEEITAWDVDVRPDGTGLPPGSGNAYDGEEIFAEVCAACHGDFAEGVDNWPVLAGGFDTLADEDPVKTVGSYWPYLSTVWDYVHRSMPFGGAGELTNDETYAIVAYILYSNDIIDDEFELSAETWHEVAMPNADGFIVDDRAETEYPKWSGEPCMEGCKPEKAVITKRATDLNVTPGQDHSKDAMGATMAAVDATEEAPKAVDLVAAGEKVFKKCASCHAIGANAKHKTGPLLTGIFGQGVGAADGFKYSAAFKDAGAGGMIWDDETMRLFLANPKGMIKGTKMSFSGLKKDADLDAIMAYLKSYEQ